MQNIINSNLCRLAHNRIGCRESIEEGLLAFWTYGYFVYLAIGSSFRILKDGNSRGTAVLVISAVSYALLSCLAMNIFDGQRAFDVPFYLALFSYAYGCAQKKEPVGALSVERDFSDVSFK